ncbi:sigma-E processing peptidase SpoIIGA [Halalkalibacillus sediminis]|uniref:sigma-E processing peptidase SpoIIGA n=1 Tax=Halalkalibacillus sediminis TaxID=2018042 RepID=UPI00138FC5EB|nr:sigma-E processing peptidase SpoIIGA [Halalkalibacillus sediminis]
MDIYLDLIWLLNLVFDWMVLLTVAWVTRKSFSHARIGTASLFASLIVPLSFVPFLVFLNNPISKILYSIMIILLAFPFGSLKLFLTRWLMFYIINFSIGGGLFALQYYFSTASVPPFMSFAQFGSNISWLFVIIFFPLILWLTKDQLHHLSVIQLNNNQLYAVEIKINKECHDVTGFYDTGNQLSHPTSGQPVILIDKTTSEEWFGKEAVQGLAALSPESSGEKFQYIPYKKAGGAQGLLPVCLADSVTVHADQSYTTRGVWVGIHFGEFSRKMDYNCLLNPFIIHSKNGVIKSAGGMTI